MGRSIQALYEDNEIGSGTLIKLQRTFQARWDELEDGTYSREPLIVPGRA